MMMNIEAICLALTIYHEARNQPIDGQVAVAEVVLNRVEDPRFANDVCSVVFEPHQFTWTEHATTPNDHTAWMAALIVAQAILDDPEGTLPGTRSTHYHEVSVTPRWAASMHPTVIIKDHVFYE